MLVRLMHLMDGLKTLDASLFLAINHWGRPMFDPFMRLISNRNFWWAVAAGVTALVAFKRSGRIWAVWVLILFTVGVSDAFTYYILKEYFQRIRPCFALPDVRLVQATCGGRYSFPSNHAATGMAIAVVTAYAFRSSWTLVVFAGTLLVGLSRIYLGVHFPGDILGGFLEGAILGTCLFFSAQFIAKGCLALFGQSRRLEC
jgi:undecaprenyl-diphosphatase